MPDPSSSTSAWRPHSTNNGSGQSSRPAGQSIGNRPIQPLPSNSHGQRPAQDVGQAKEDIKPLLHELDGDEGKADGARKKRIKRSGGKACVYCRRSHMVCEGGRPCERCLKREIGHLCRDVSPPAHRHRSDTSQARTASPPHINMDTNILANLQSSSSNAQSSNLPTSLYSDPNFPPAWPLLPDTAGPVTYGDGSGSSEMPSNGGMGSTLWNAGDDSELGALTKYLGDLGVPSLPGGFLDVLSYFSRGGTGNNGNNLSGVPLPGITEGTSQGNTGASTPITGIGTHGGGSSMLRGASADGVPVNSDITANGKGKGKEVAFAPVQLSGISRIERYFLAAADQPSGPRASRLAQVIKAKYDAGLLKPYDYIKGYERMNKWMDSGRAGPKTDSVVGSAPSSPQKGGRSRLVSATPTPAYGSSISPESRRRILTALNGFRPKFRQIARTLTDVDLVFVEEAMERWMLEYDRAFASIHTPSCIWRRTGEIQKANQEFANLTGIPASMFRGGVLCVYELMDEDSAVRYWEGYAKIAFDSGQRSLYTSCTLKIPMSLSRSRPPRPSATPASLGTRAAAASGPVPDLALPQPLIPSHNTGVGGGDAYMAMSDISATGIYEEYREIKCCFSVTIRRDAWGVPVAIMGQWIPI